MLEASKLTFSAGLEVAILVFVVYFYLEEISERKLARFFLAGSLIGLIAGLVLAWLPLGQSPDIKLWINKGHLLFSGGFILLSLLALPGLEPHFLIGLENVLTRRKIWLSFLSFIWGLALLPLEGLSLVLNLKTMVFLKESNAPYFFAVLGLISSLAAAYGFFYLFRLVKVGRFFSFSGLLFFIIAAKALWEPIIIASIEVIVARILHDLVHWLVVFLLLPDHIYLTRTFWNLLGFFFRKDTSLIINLAFILSIGVFLMVYLLSRPLPELKGVEKGADRRKIWAGIKNSRRWQTLSILVAAAMLMSAGYTAFGSGRKLYQPTPRPVSANARGLVEVPATQVSDGLIHVYSFAHDEKIIRFAVIKKPDGNFAVTLDCCLICPPTTPTSYAQMGQDLFCVYCGTPIPVDSVGKPGGCNPVPIPFKVIGGSKLQFDAVNALGVWERVNKGK